MPDEPDSDTTKPATGDCGKGRILVFDDERTMCDMIAKHLRVREFEFETFTTAIEALQQFRDDDFDVVLTDENMPELNGIEFCQNAAAIRPDIPVVVMTAFGGLETAVEAIRAGAFDFVTKPIEMDMLAIARQEFCQY